MATILVVDDDPDLLAEICEYLGRQGYTVHSAGGFAAARTAFERERAGLDIVLTDVRMPDGDGVALVRQIRADGFKGRCLLMTGHLELAQTPPEWRDEVTLLPKPFSFKVLKAMLEAKPA
jgi:two-component system response regulator GlrR